MRPVFIDDDGRIWPNQEAQMKTKTLSHSQYHRTLYDHDKFKKAVQVLTRRIRALNKEHGIQAIACCGMSGAALAFPVSLATQIPVIFVRKEGDQTHGQEVEGPCTKITKYAIIDDLVSSCATLTHIVTSIEASLGPRPAKQKAQCVEILLYNDNCNDTLAINGKLISVKGWSF